MNDAASLLLRLERERCQALVAGDVARLRHMLHPDLFHVHARGNVEDYDAYAESALHSVFSSVERFEDLQVRVFGDVAFMSGRQLAQSVRKSTGDHVRIDSMVTQLWKRDGGQWRQLSYQTTPIEMTVMPAA